MRALQTRYSCTLPGLGHTTDVAPEEPQHLERRSRTVRVLARPAASDRLDSWKEIASHLKRTVRTVQRWERQEGLPVHRHLHRHANSVYAHRSELDNWWNREVRSVEDNPTVLFPKDPSPKAASTQVVKAIDSTIKCEQKEPTSAEWFVECALEIRLVGFRSSSEGTGRPASVLRVPIPLLVAPPRTGAAKTTRDAKVLSPSLSLADSLGPDESRRKAIEWHVETRCSEPARGRWARRVACHKVRGWETTQCKVN